MFILLTQYTNLILSVAYFLHIELSLIYNRNAWSSMKFATLLKNIYISQKSNILEIRIYWNLHVSSERNANIGSFYKLIQIVLTLSSSDYLNTLKYGLKNTYRFLMNPKKIIMFIIVWKEINNTNCFKFALHVKECWNSITSKWNPVEIMWISMKWFFTNINTVHRFDHILRPKLFAIFVRENLL